MLSFIIKTLFKNCIKSLVKIYSLTLHSNPSRYSFDSRLSVFSLPAKIFSELTDTLGFFAFFRSFPGSKSLRERLVGLK